jgi:hypothetical protein
MAQNITPKRSAIKKEEAFNVDKIASQLKSFATEIDKANARLVQFTLREIIKTPPEQRHLSAVDDFADMPSIAEEPGSASEGALRIQFKVCNTDLTSYQMKLTTSSSCMLVQTSPHGKRTYGFR